MQLCRRCIGADTYITCRGYPYLFRIIRTDRKRLVIGSTDKVGGRRSTGITVGQAFLYLPAPGWLLYYRS